MGRLGRVSAYVIVAIAAVLVGVVGSVLVVLYVVGENTEADPWKARVEVQNYYEVRFPGRVEVVDCDYAPADSVFDQFECSVQVKCRQRFLFSVPRAASLFRGDRDVSAIDGRGGKPRCVA